MVDVSGWYGSGGTELQGLLLQFDANKTFIGSLFNLASVGTVKPYTRIATATHDGFIYMRHRKDAGPAKSF